MFFHKFSPYFTVSHHFFIIQKALLHCAEAKLPDTDVTALCEVRTGRE